MSSTEQQIDDAVAKRHVQNTDTAAGAQSADLDMNLHKIIGLADPTGDKDGANKEYVDTHGGGGGGGDVVGPGSAVNNALPLFDGTTGKLIKDSVRLIEDALSDGDNLPDGHAIKIYGDANWCEGSGDVSGPAANTDDYVPQWNGADSKLLKNGFAITAAGKALVDDVDASAQRVTLGLLSAALRDAEDAMTDGANLPDGHAIKTYGDANWGGGYTNLIEFITQTAFRVFYSNTDGDVTELALGADGTYLKSNGPAVNPSFGVPGGGGDVIGPGSAVDNALPLFDGVTGKLIKDSTRLVEDTMTDGSNLPDGHAVKTYGDTNWGGGSSKWTDAGTYIRPNAGAGYCVLDAGTDLTAITFAADTTYVLAPGATYDIGSSVIISNNRVAIIGNGATIRKIAQADGIRITGNYCTVDGATINGNAQGWAGIFITGSNNTIDGVVSHNNGGIGIGQDGQSTTCQHNKIVNCTACSNGEIGISMNDVDFSIVSNNTSYSNTLEGFTCDANSPGWASSCTFDGNVAFDNRGGVGQFGIDRAKNCVFSNNIVDGYAGLDGMKTQNNQGPVEFCVFTGNLLVNNGGYGINITSGAGGASNHNKLVGNIYRNNTSGDHYVISGQDNVIIESDSGSSKWTDDGTYIYPTAAGNVFRVYDDDRLWHKVGSIDPFLPPYQEGPLLMGHATAGSYAHNQNTYGNIYHLSSWVENTGTSPIVGVFGYAIAKGDGAQGWGGNFGSYATVAGATAHGVEINYGELAAGAAGSYGCVINPCGDYETTACIQIQAANTNCRSSNGIVFNGNAFGAVTDSGALITTLGTNNPAFGIDFSLATFSDCVFRVGASATPHLACTSGDLKFYDPVTGAKTLAELAAGGGGGLNNVVEDLTPELGGHLEAGNHQIRFANAQNLIWRNAANTDWITALHVSNLNNIHVGSAGAEVIIGENSSNGNPVLIRINDTNNQRLVRSSDTDSAGKHYVTLD